MTSCAANSINVITSYTRGITYPTHDDYLYSVITCTTGATYPTYDDYLYLIKNGTGATTLIPAAWGSTFAIDRVGTTGSTFLFQLSFRLFLQPVITRMPGVFPMPVWSRFFHSRFFCEVHHD